MKPLKYWRDYTSTSISSPDLHHPKRYLHDVIAYHSYGFCFSVGELTQCIQTKKSVIKHPVWTGPIDNIVCELLFICNVASFQISGFAKSRLHKMHEATIKFTSPLLMKPLKY